MAEVYRYPEGVFVPGTPDDPLNYVFAHYVDVMAEVASIATSRGAMAKATLGAHRSEGVSSIDVEKSKSGVDWTVWLTDDSLKGAYAIEFGRKGGRGDVGPLAHSFPEAELGGHFG